MHFLRPLGRLAPALLLALLGGCSDLFPPPYEYGTVEVVTQRRDGTPVAGVELTLYTGARPLAYGVSGPDGRYRFDLVPFGQLGVLAGPPKEYRPLDLRSGYVATLTLPEAGRDSVSFTYLKFGDGSVEVQAREPDGRAIPNVELELYEPTGVFARGRTDSAGFYRFPEVPFGDYGVLARPPSRFRTERGARFAVTEGLLIEDGWKERVQLVFRRCEGDVRVRAVDDEGRPVAGLPIQLYTAQGVQQTAVTGADGEHVFAALECGDYGVFRLPRIGYLFEEGRGQSYVDGLLIDGGDRETALFTLTRCTGRIRGRVTDAAGAPVADVAVLLYTSEAVQQEVRTDAEGRYLFPEVGCFADYGVMVMPPEGFTAGEGRGKRYYDAVAVGQGVELDFPFVLTRL